MSLEVGERRVTRPLLWWDLACAAALLFIAAVNIIDSFAGDPYWMRDAGLGARITVLLAPAALFAVVYVGLGRRAILRGICDERATPTTNAFQAAMLFALLIGTFIDPMYAMLQTIVYPVVWTINPDYRAAVLWCVAVAAATGGGLYLGLVPFDPAAATLSSVITAVLSLTFAVGMGTWITRIHQRGEAFKALAEELRDSRDEVAALSQEAGASAERERLSRDLHDTLTQTLAGLVMLSEQAERALDSGDEDRARERLTRVASAARSAVSEARALVATTQPIGEDGLVNSIERVAAALRADTGLEVECTLEQPELERESEVVVLRAAQEAMANARKHASAERVSVKLSAAGPGGAVLVVEDDGVGPGGGTREGGFGLIGLADRVRAVGGELSFGAREGGGSRLEVRLARSAEA